MPKSVHSRDPAVSLSGEWQFQTDPDDIGAAAAWYDRDETWADSQSVSLPHSWQERDELREYTGTAWYRKTFEFEDFVSDERVVLVFGAVDYETTVWVNGQEIGTHEGGYLPFDFDVTDAVDPGENTVTLRVYDPEDMTEIPHGKQGDPWYTRVSGPWQSIDLVTVPETHVESVRVTPDISDDSATFEVSIHSPRASPPNLDGEYELEVTIAREGDRVVETTTPVSGSDTTATLDVPDAEYWTPDEPVLYDYSVSLVRDGVVVDSYDRYFGMRSVSYEDGTLYLNGEPFTMRGALDQAFYPDTFYRPQDLETFEREIRAAKDLGFNLLRKHIKPAHPEFVELADRLGMLVWEEPANPKRYTGASKRRLKRQLRRMIDRDYNSPSVIAWSIYNEEWGIGSAEGEESLWEDEEKQDYLEQLYEQTLDWDPTRLVCDNSGWAHVATDINDYHEYFVVPDRVEAWRDQLDEIIANPEENYGDVRTSPEEAPLVMSEFGTWGLSDVSRLEEHYDGAPHWFDHGFLEGMKRPGGVRERFQNSHATTAFDSLEEMADAWQHREFQSLETIIADMRSRDEVAGYVVTELTDIEWEFNGILDYLREEKAFHDDFARVNAPVMLHLEPSTSVAWSGETVTADLVLVNDTTSDVETSVTFTTPGTETSREVEIGANESVRLSEALSFDASTGEGTSSVEITAEAPALDQTVTRDIYVTPDAEPADSLSVYAPDADLREALSARGYETVADEATADVAVVTDPAGADGSALVVPERDGHPDESEQFSFRTLPERESWNLCASFVYQTLLPEVGEVPGWALEDIYPYGYVTDTEPEDDVLAGYTEGWVENSGAIVMTRSTDERTLGVCTLRVTDTYGDHPLATAIVDRLLAKIA